MHLDALWRDGYPYAKAGVTLWAFYQSGVAQLDMFSQQLPRANADALMSGSFAGGGGILR